MPSFDVVNYSLRPSKSIQRELVFKGAKAICEGLECRDLVYVGFGSIWFTDFVMAHKLLDVNDMRSFEAHDVGYLRAQFNKPYATVKVLKGYSHDMLPEMYKDESIKQRPWMIWLDYDREFTEQISDDIRSLVEKAPPDSLLLVTFAGNEMKYGAGPERPQRLRELFGSIVPDDLSKRACRDDRLLETLSTFALDYMKSIAADTSRPGGFIPSFRLIYKDGAPMITVGGVLPSLDKMRAVSDLIAAPDWPSMPDKPIVAPHLTIREAAVLQSQLPRGEKLSRAAVQALGFDLDDEHIEVFERYYRQYPAFAQIIA